MLTKTQKNNREKLIAALRSGKYKQGTEYLRTHSKGFCCQGVACDIFKKDVGGEWSLSGNEIEFCLNQSGDDFADNRSIEWPDEVGKDLLGFDAKDSRQFVCMNDGCGQPSHLDWSDDAGNRYTLVEQCTFDEIADCMELLTLAGL